MKHIFNIKVSSHKTIKFELCDWDDYGYHYRWNVSINNEVLGDYVLIPFDHNGKLVLANEISDLDISNKNECKFTFISRALDEKFYLKLFEKLKEPKEFLEYINDIIFSTSVIINNKKIDELEKLNGQEFIISTDDILLINSSSEKLNRSQDNNYDIMEYCFFRNKCFQQIKIRDLLNRSILESYDIKVVLLFAYKSYLLGKNLTENNTLSLIKNIFLNDKIDLTFINSEYMKDLILNDNMFQKLNYETIIFSLIKDGNKKLSKDLFSHFVLYCFNNNFQEGKRYLVDHNLIKQPDQENIGKIHKLSKKIKELLSISDEKELPLLCTYTNIQSARKIYESKKYYLSEIHQMNDPLENRVFESFSSQRLIGSLKYYNVNTYVMSLTDRVDYLPMWNTYGDNCLGVCCIFDNEFLTKLKDRIFKVCYIKRIPSNILDIFNEFINIFSIFDDEIKDGLRETLNEASEKIRNTIIVGKISGNNCQKHKEKKIYNDLKQVRRLMISYIEKHDSIIIKGIYCKLTNIIDQLDEFYNKDSNECLDENSKEDLAIVISRKLNCIKKLLQGLSDIGKEVAMADVVNLLGPIMKFEDYSYEHEYRVIAENISLSQIKIDTKEFEEEICKNKNSLKYKLDLGEENKIFESLIFGPKLQYDMIYPRFEIEWNKTNVLLQKSEIHYR